MPTADHMRPFLAGLTESTLVELHEAIKLALEEDDATPGKKKYGVRVFADFRIEADLICEILGSRGVHCEAIRW